MINKTLGAPLGGTMRAGQYGFESLASRSILPPNFSGGGGSWSPGMVMVAAGEPGGGVAGCACCANAGPAIAEVTSNVARIFGKFILQIPSRARINNEGCRG